jgi:TRAP-type mannitol/chloroaromatic compound transport system substrate-binding protein
MGHGAAYYWAGKVPAAQFMSAVPFGMTAKGMNAWFYSGGGLELWREMYQPFKGALLFSRSYQKSPVQRNFVLERQLRN